MSFECPRRMEMSISYGGATPEAIGDYVDAALAGIGDPEPKDTWRVGRDGVRGCSHCGSMHPEDFFDAIAKGLKVGPTDKNYKVYIDGYPDPRAGEQRVISGCTDGKPSTAMDGWVKVGRKERRDMRRDGWQGDYTWIRYATRSTLQLKLYTLHLNREDAARLRRLLDEHKVNIGYPGYFYNGLWLAKPKASDA